MTSPPVSGGGPPYRLNIPPDLARLANVREWLGDIAAHAGLTESRVFDVQVVASEAAANAIEHAASGVTIEVWDLHDRLVVQIVNDGEFQPGIYKDDDHRRRGLGLPLMVSLADHVHVSRLSAGRTKITLTFFTDAYLVAQDNVDFLPGASDVGGNGGAASAAGLGSHPAMWLLLAPIPLLILAVGVLYGLHFHGASESASLLTAFNTLFVSAGSFIIAYLAARTYLAGSSAAMLLLGAGALVLGLGHILAGPLITNANGAVGIYNSLFFVSGVLFAVAGFSMVRRRKPPEASPALSRVVLTYGVALGVVVVLYVLIATDTYPAFYVPGAGYTLARDIVVGLGVMAFLFAAVCFIRVYRTRPSAFALLLGASFALFAVSLGSLALTGAVTGSPINWVTRAGIWIAGLYLLVGVLGAAYRRGWLLPLERSLRESEDRYRNLVDLTPDAVFVHSAGRYLFANQAAVQMLRYLSPKDIVGKDLDQILAPATRQISMERIGEAYAGAVSPSSDEMFLRADGSVLEVSVVSSRVEFGGQLAVQTVARDITERKRAEEEQRSLLERLQRAFLDMPASVPGVEFGYEYRSGTRGALIGGDFYDLFPLLDGLVGLVIGDVSGHGLSASRSASMVKDSFRLLLTQGERPRSVLAETNHFLANSGFPGFVTAFLGVLDLRTGDLTYASAGHLGPLATTKDGGVERLDFPGSLPLAAFPDSVYEEHHGELHKGDLLVLYTDGLTEARRNGSFYGEAGLAESLGRHKSLPAPEVAHALVQDAVAFGSGGLSDDAALLAVRFQGISR